MFDSYEKNEQESLFDIFRRRLVIIDDYENSNEGYKEETSYKSTLDPKMHIKKPYKDERKNLVEKEENHEVLFDFLIALLSF